MGDLAMDGKLVHEFISTLVWPAIVVAAFFIFRRQFPTLLDRISKLSAGGVSVELKERVDSLQEMAERLEREKQTDDDAIAMVDIQLSETLSPPFKESILVNAVKQASSAALETIYSRAKSVRKSAWQALQEKRKGSYRTAEAREQAIGQSIRWMERTIPIFRALTELQHRKRWHRYYAQLGYALKDTGNIREARTALKTAIDAWKRQTGMPVSPHYRFPGSRSVPEVATSNVSSALINRLGVHLPALIAEFERDFKKVARLNLAGQLRICVELKRPLGPIQKR
jgi:hypothetical protein